MKHDYLMLTDRLRQCAVCGEPTYWAHEKQLRNLAIGMCVTHGGPMRNEPDYRNARRALIREFPLAIVEDYSPTADEGSQKLADGPTLVRGRWIKERTVWRFWVDFSGPELPEKDSH